MDKHPTSRNKVMIVKRGAWSCIVLLMVLFVQCNPDTAEQKVNPPERTIDLKTENSETPEKVNTPNDSIYKHKKTDPNSKFSLDTQLHYVPDVETCLYIRTSPEISNSNIIQCLIPESREAFITEMYHELIPTGITNGNWAEFSYSFDVYTHKPDVQDNVNMSKWLEKRDEAHSIAKRKYRTYRKKGWVKYKNSDGTLNIKIKKYGC